MSHWWMGKKVPFRFSGGLNRRSDSPLSAAGEAESRRAEATIDVSP